MNRILKVTEINFNTQLGEEELLNKATWSNGKYHTLTLNMLNILILSFVVFVL